MVFQNNQLEVMRMAPKRTCPGLPFGIWMALAKATPLKATELADAESTGQVALTVLHSTK